MSILEIQSTWRLKSKSLNLFSRVLVPLAAKDPLVFCAAMTTSVQRYQEYGRSIWDLRNEKRKKNWIIIIQTLTSTPKVRETGCSLTSPGIVASEDSLTKDDCHQFCSGLTIGCCQNHAHNFVHTWLDGLFCRGRQFPQLDILPLHRWRQVGH